MLLRIKSQYKIIPKNNFFDRIFVKFIFVGLTKS